MFDEVCERQAALMAEWIRVGYCQGNMNSDNSALAGFTLDYGPFAFIHGELRAAHNPWVGGGESYSFAGFLHLNLGLCMQLQEISEPLKALKRGSEIYCSTCQYSQNANTEPP